MGNDGEREGSKKGNDSGSDCGHWAAVATSSRGVGSRLINRYDKDGRLWELPG